MTQEIWITYESHLPSFLDDKGIEWSSGTGKFQDIICVYLPTSTPEYIWYLRKEFEQWKVRYCNQ